MKWFVAHHTGRAYANYADRDAGRGVYVHRYDIMVVAGKRPFDVTSTRFMSHRLTREPACPYAGQYLNDDSKTQEFFDAIVSGVCRCIKPGARIHVYNHDTNRWTTRHTPCTPAKESDMPISPYTYDDEAVARTEVDRETMIAREEAALVANLERLEAEKAKYAAIPAEPTPDQDGCAVIWFKKRFQIKGGAEGELGREYTYAAVWTPVGWATTGPRAEGYTFDWKRMWLWIQEAGEVVVWTVGDEGWVRVE